MSRRRGEFEHRTSIFEGAFRAWSHLGGLDPEDLEGVKSQEELDPLTNPIQNDVRLNGKHKDSGAGDPDRRLYPYEPLPRSGLAHPYVQAILSPWLGPDADNDAIQLGLTTLRTWWQHRRKGESGSAIAALGTEKMKGVVEGYTRHFFQLAHCLVMNDKEQPPRSLHSKMKELEKMRSKGRKKNRDEGKDVAPALPKGGTLAAGIQEDLTNKNLSPLEQLHRAQQRQLAVEGGIQSCVPQGMNSNNTVPVINIKNKCAPGAVDLPAVVDAVNHQANQLAHSGANRSTAPAPVPSAVVNPTTTQQQPTQYGDPDMVPIVFICENTDILLAMAVDGITCAHCVKIVETVLKGCNGNKSPIDGLLDAAADRVLCSVLLKIDKMSNAKRIAFEAARNLAMVGYNAKAKEMSASIEQNGKKEVVSADQLYKAFSNVARNDPKDVFDWSIPCTCPDNGVLRDDCSRHSQMSPSIFETFDNRGLMVTQYLYGAKHQQPTEGQNGQGQPGQFPSRPQQLVNFDNFPIQNLGGSNPQMGGMNPRAMGQNGMDMFQGNVNMGDGGGMMQDRAQRNPSIISFGGRNMSFASRRSYGRAMSGLSALAIDWENMEDFDVDVDHSAHINNNMGPPDALGGNDIIMDPRPLNAGNGRRSSIRQSFMIGSSGSNNNGNNDAQRVCTSALIAMNQDESVGASLSRLSKEWVQVTETVFATSF
eukprot:scaffold11032_cov122-Cylindrotheca_fusiformis.AAC.16